MVTQRKRILHELSIDKIAAVDRPCQEFAEVRIMKTITHAGPLAFETFEAAVAHLHGVQGGSRSAAMSAAARRYPELVERYNDDGIEFAKATAEAGTSRPDAKAVADFELAVDEVIRRDRCTRSQAMSRAREEYPAAFEAYQSA